MHNDCTIRSWQRSSIAREPNRSASYDELGWKLYFPNAEESLPPPTVRLHVETIERHFKSFPREYSACLARKEHCFEFKLLLARRDIHVRDRWPTLHEDFVNRPEYTIAIIGMAMYWNVLRNDQRHNSVDCPTYLPVIKPWFNYFGPTVPIQSIDRSQIGKLITIRGACTCESYVNEPIESTRAITLAENGYAISVAFENSYLPKKMKNNLYVGDELSITGIVAQINDDIILRAVSIQSNKNALLTAENGEYLKILDVPIRVAAFPFKLLVQSLCPAIAGFESIKAGLLLALFSRSKDLHVLLVGGKKELRYNLLQSCTQASPRGILISDPSLPMGLHCMKDSNGESCINAGPLVLTDLGVCCLEEIEKVADLENLLKIIHDQEASLCCLERLVKVPARTTLIVGTSSVEPDDSKTFLECLPLPRSVVEEFSLVFHLKECADPNDKLVCPNGIRLNPEQAGSNKCCVEVPLVRQLRNIPVEFVSLLSLEQIRNYIEHTRRYCRPQFTEHARSLLANFFVQLHSVPAWLEWKTERIARNIENMVRARATIDLCEEISDDHVMDTIRIIARSWYDKYDSDDRPPLLCLSAGQTRAKVSNLRPFLQSLRLKAISSGTRQFSTSALHCLARELCGAVGGEDELIEKLNLQGFLLKKPCGLYELIG
ncbi:DNA helicase MCM8-like isoform X1 [Anopheles albimanus]|uniref:DNA helicase MCM8-like isoform X1 n=1 Tax=Anopheles albimanus TaxID=7167 RepID=UPI001640A655|nr:DNA helicase MCM8-like isoform X1 [Anopheles albimanus]